MVIDALENSASYLGMGKGFAQAFAWLRSQDLTALAPGSYEIDGKQVYALVQHNTLKSEAEAAWECHRLYADIQYVVDGRERMGAALLGSAEAAAVDYNEVKDFAKLADRPGVYAVIKSGEFALFLPQDAHRPGLRTTADAAGPEQVRKVVVKVRVGA